MVEIESVIAAAEGGGRQIRELRLLVGSRASSSSARSGRASQSTPADFLGKEAANGTHHNALVNKDHEHQPESIM